MTNLNESLSKQADCGAKCAMTRMFLLKQNVISTSDSLKTQTNVG